VDQCDVLPPKFAGDPHARRVGYTKIAGTFERELQPLLP